MKIVDLTGRSKGPYFSVVDAKYLIGYKLRLTFNDKSMRVVDFENFLSDAPQPWITKYRDLKEFKKFKIVGGNLNWNDYEMIFPVAHLRRGYIEYTPPKPLQGASSAMRAPTTNGHAQKNIEIPLPLPMIRRLKARAKKEDVPLELLVQRYLEESMGRQGERTRKR